MNERTPPKDIDAEKALLGSMMMSREAINEVLPIIEREDGAWFYLPAHQKLFECLVDPARWADLRRQLIDTVDLDTDSLRFYFLGKHWQRRIEHVGAKPSYNPHGPLIV